MSEFYYDENRNLVEGTPPEGAVVQGEEEEKKEVAAVTADANGTTLENGDSIVAIKGLPVKGGVDIKKGEKFTSIRLLEDDLTHVAAKSAKNGKIFLKTEYFKKVG